MSDIKDIATALAAFQREMPVLKKTGQNFTKGNAATIGDVVTIARQGAKHGLSYVQKVSRDEMGSYLESVMMHTSGQWLSSGLYPVIPEKDSPSSFGAAVTFARKNSLMALFGIADHNDEDIDWNLDSEGNHIVNPPKDEKPEGKGKVTLPDSGQEGSQSTSAREPAGGGVGQSEAPTPNPYKPKIKKVVAETPEVKAIDSLRRGINGCASKEEAVTFIKEVVGRQTDIVTVQMMYQAVKPSEPDVVQIFQQKQEELQK
jgi:hypothetical protein